MVAAGHAETAATANKGRPVERMMQMARAMIEAVRSHVCMLPNGHRLQVRIGLACGPAFAGVIGSKCPRYCFIGESWGPSHHDGAGSELLALCASACDLYSMQVCMRRCNRDPWLPINPS